MPETRTGLLTAIAVALLMCPTLAPVLGATPAVDEDEGASVRAGVSGLEAAAALTESRMQALTAAGLLEALSRGGATVDPEGVLRGWDLYFSAFGLESTASEQRALREFSIANPHVASEIAKLAEEVGWAERLREAVLGSYSAAEQEALHRAAAKLSTGGSAPLTVEERALVDAFDLRSMVEAGRIATAAAERAAVVIPVAMERDRLLREAIPAGILDGGAPRDPLAAVRAAVGDARPVRADATLDVILTALMAGTGGSPPSADSWPVDLAEPLANVLAATLRDVDDASPESGRAVVATIAAELPRLVRASYNLSAASPDALRRLEPGSTASDLPVGTHAPIVVIERVLGPAGAASDEPVPLLVGLRAMHDALGTLLSEEDAARAEELEKVLGPEVSGRLGRLLAAQARYQEDLGPDSPILHAATSRRAVALEIAASGGDISPDEIRLLQESAAAERELRAVASRDATAVYRAALALRDHAPGATVPAKAGKVPASPIPVSMPADALVGGGGAGAGGALEFVEHPAPVERWLESSGGGPLDEAAPTPLDGLLYYDGILLVAGPGSSTLTVATVPVAPVLAFDLGGDDVYRIPLAGVDAREATAGVVLGPRATLTSVAIDLGGDDAYVGVEPYSLGGAIGAGSLGFALLVDADGDDTYEGDDAVLGYGEDSLGFLLDLAGSDRYRSLGRGLAWTGTTSTWGSAAGVLVDLEGEDEYRSGAGFARMAEGSTSLSGHSVFVDGAGIDRYLGDCPMDPDVSCFAYPQSTDAAYGETWGVSVFMEIGGGAEFPRRGDPGDGTLQLGFTRTVIVERGTLEYGDADGDLLPDEYESDGTRRDPVREDTDHDGSPDAVESVIGTDPRDAGDSPADAAKGPGAPDGGGFLLNLPGRIAIGLPGTTNYTREYVLTLDLGLTDADAYTNVTAVNGFSVDLGGDDRYAPPEGIPLALAAAVVEVPPVSAAADGVANSPGGNWVRDPRGIAKWFAFIFGEEAALRDRVDGIIERFTDFPVHLAMDAGASAVAGASMLASSRSRAGTSLLLDLGGDDSYASGPRSQAFADGPGALALLVDVSGNDRYEARSGQAQAYAVRSGSAVFVDSAGDDSYKARTQAVVARGATSPHELERWRSETRSADTSGRLALFLDQAGSDSYTREQSAIARAAWDDTQGVAAWAHGSPSDAQHAGVAAFLDLGSGTSGSDDRYWMLTEESRELEEFSPLKNNRLRVDPLDGGAPRAIEVFLDLPSGSSDSDRDGGAAGRDDAEAFAGSDASDPDDSVQGAGFVLRIPRIGVAVGAPTSTRYSPRADFALQVDLGGTDTYLNRAGATSLRWGTAVSVDLGGRDAYYHNATGASGNRVASVVGDGSEDGTAVSGSPGIPFALGTAQGAGVLGVGVLVSVAASDFYLSTNVSGVPGAPAPVVATIGQGAGVLGVGVLSVGEGVGGAASSFRSSVNVTDAPGTPGDAFAFTLAQGAAAAGVGLLVSQNPLAADSYTLASSHAGGLASSRTMGQGYGANSGVGILLDHGGNNEFRARDRSQGAAESASSAIGPVRIGAHGVREARGFVLAFGDAFWNGLTTIGTFSAGNYQIIREESQNATPSHLPSGIDAPRAPTALGALILPGPGNDDLRAGSRSQAFATGGGVAVLFDADGDDRRLLDETNGARSLGQGASELGGVAILLDNRGNDRYTASSHAQGFSDHGGGLLLDLAGDDVYEAKSHSQAHVGLSNVARQSAPLALLVDRRGHDEYILQPGAPGQGHVTVDDESLTLLPESIGPPPIRLREILRFVYNDAAAHAESITAVRGSALFLDLGGTDLYRATPPDRVPVDLLESVPGLTSTGTWGNGAAWSVSWGGPGTQASLVAYGRDADPAGDVLAEGDNNVSKLEVSDWEGWPMDAGSNVEGVLTLKTRIPTHNLVGNVPRTAFDRADFYFGTSRGDHEIRTLVGTQLPEANSNLKDPFELSLDTAETDALGRAAFPDGSYTIEALLYPRVGTPTSEDPNAEGRAVAVDGEPFRAFDTYYLDNPPSEPVPTVRGNVSLAQGAVPLRLWVERDLAEAGVACWPSCDAPPPGFAPFDDEWNRPLTPNPYGTAPPSVPCAVEAGCAVVASAESGNGSVYLSWETPAVPEGLGDAVLLVGYDVSRRVESSPTFAFVTFSDSRLPTRLGVVDPAPEESSVTYRVDAVYVADGRTVAVRGIPTTPVAVDDSRPGPVAGLRAYPVHGAVHLAWNAVEGAAYEVCRSAIDPVTRAPGVPTCEPVSPSGPVLVWSTTEVTNDIEYVFRVVAIEGSVAGVNSTATATPSVGHWVRAHLESGEEGTSEIVVVPSTYVAGGRDHTLLWSAIEVPEGEHVLVTRVEEDGGRANETRTNVRIDHTPPVTELLLPRFVGTSFSKNLSLLVPFRVEDAESGVRETIVYARVGDQPWTEIVWRPSANDSRRGVLANGSVNLTGIRHGESVELVVLAYDHAGNVAFPGANPWPAYLNRPTDGLAAAIESGRTTSHVIDLRPPTAAAADRTWILRPGDLLEIGMLPMESGTGIESAVAEIGAEEIPLVANSSKHYNGAWTATAEGTHQVVAVFTDRASNVGRIPLGTVTVDPEPPRLLEASALFADGRYAGHLGEHIRLRVVAQDGVTPEERVIVRADASNVSSVGEMELQFDHAQRAFVSREFPLDRPQPDGSGLVTVAASDEAGNERRSSLRVVLDATVANASTPRVVRVDAGGVVIEWETEEPSFGKVEFGTDARLDQRTPIGPEGVRHTLNVTNLIPDTVYTARAVSIAVGGIETRSAFFTFRTSPGLEIGVVPSSGVPFTNGSMTLDVRVGAFDGRDLASGSVEAILEKDGRLPIWIGTAEGLVLKDWTVPIGTARDGTYDLVFRATAGGLHGRSAPIPIVVDRLPPMIAAAAGGTLVTDGIARVEVEERGSGIDVANVSWTVEGEPCTVHESNGTLRCAIPENVRDDVLSSELVLVDRAGNVALQSLLIDVDGSAPNILEAYVQGGSAGVVRPDSDAEVVLRVADRTLAKTHVDLSGVQGPDHVMFRPGETGLLRAKIRVPNLPDGDYVIRVVAEDLAGRQTSVDVPIRVDGTPPKVVSGTVDEVGFTWARVKVRTDEPVVAEADAPHVAGAPREDEVATASDAQLLVLEGIPPGYETEVVVRVRDLAGNAATSRILVRTMEDSVPPDAVTDLRAEDAGGGRIHLRWSVAEDVGSGVVSYAVSRRTDGSASDQVGSAVGTTFLDLIERGSLVRYYVSAVDAAGNAGPNASVLVTPRFVPRLHNGSVHPPIGGPGQYVFRVEVERVGVDLPSVHLEIDGVAHEMRIEDATCKEACAFVTLVHVAPESFTSGPHRYRFSASLDGLTAKHPAFESFVGPTVVASMPPPEHAALRSGSVLSTVSSASAAGFVLLAVAVALTVRIRKR